MAHTAKCGRRFGRAIVAGLLLAGVALVANVPAQPAKQEPQPAAKAAPPRKAVITLPKDATSDVVETVRVINDKLEQGWKDNNLTPSEPCTDYEFIRRASVDIIGRIAKPDEIAEFLKDPPQFRRSLLIDRLLKSPDYPRQWANVWTNWLLSRAGVFGRGTYHEQLATWMEDQFAQNRPHHEVVRDLITAKGKNTENAAVNFVLAHVGEAVQPANRQREDGQFEMIPVTSRVTRLFLGVQTQCTQCHDHPFDANLRQDHFWGINAFMRQVRRNGTPPQPQMRRQMGYPMLELVEDDGANPTGVVAFEKRNGVVRETKPRFIDGVAPAKGVNRRAELARMVIESPSFPKATVNRMWSVFFGKGFCNPIDDFNEQNQVSNPELLGELAEKYKHYGFDNKRLIRWICNSEAYQLSCATNKTNDKAEHEVSFSRMLLKALSPEALFESLMIATQSDDGKDAQKELRDRLLESLVANFGDDEGNEVTFDGTVVQALMMMNGKDINDAIARTDKGTVPWAMKRSNFAAQRVNDIYLAVLNRPAGKVEAQKVLEKMALRPGFRDKSPEAPFQDLLWGLLNSNEFMLNH